MFLGLGAMPNLEMQLTEAADWVLKAQGAANFVYQYVGQDTALLKTVLRVQKPCDVACDLASDPDKQLIARLEAEVWGDLGDGREGMERVHCDIAYVARCIEPFLGQTYLPRAVSCFRRPAPCLGVLRGQV